MQKVIYTKYKIGYLRLGNKSGLFIFNIICLITHLSEGYKKDGSY